MSGRGRLNPEEGSLFDLSLAQVAEAVDASVLLVARPIDLYIDDLLSAKRAFGFAVAGRGTQRRSLGQTRIGNGDCAPAASGGCGYSSFGNAAEKCFAAKCQRQRID